MLSLGYRGSAEFHSQNPDTDGYFQSLSVNLDLPFLTRKIKRLEVSIIENVSYTPELPAYSFSGNDRNASERFNQVQVEDFDEKFNQVLLEGEGVQGTRVDTFRNRAGIALSYPWTENFDTGASYTNVITRYTGSNLEDSEVNSATANGSYSLRSSLRTTWSIRYGISAIFDGDNDFFHNISLGVRRTITRLLSVTGSLGADFVEGESPEPTLGAGISKRYKLGSFNLQYTSNLVTGLGVLRGVTRRQSVVGNATRKLGERISSQINVGYTSNRSFKGDEVNVSTYTGGAGLSMRLLSWLDGSLDYAYLKQETKGVLGTDGERNTVSFSLTAIAPSWRMIK